VVIAQDSPPLQAAVPVFRDLIPNCGSLGGLYTGLKQAHTPYAFVSACDMPFLDPATIRYLVSLKDNADLVLVRTENGLQPTHAVYSRRCLPVIEEMLRTRHLRIQDLVKDSAMYVRFVDQKELRRIEPDGRAFLNVNTPEDLEAANKLVAKENDPSLDS
jgi:molybdopterin-guanine dinucleotide biosynthesis protein A